MIMFASANLLNIHGWQHRVAAPLPIADVTKYTCQLLLTLYYTYLMQYEH